MKRIVKKPAERREEIVKTARELFLKNDSHTSMQDIMDQLGIAKGTIYHYFKSKDELLEAVVEDIVNEQIERMEAKVKETRGNALKKIQVLVESGRVTSASSLMEELHKKGNEAMHTRLLVAALMKQAPLYASVIEQGCEEGLFHVSNPLECAEFLLSAVQFLTDKGIHPWTPEDLARRNQAFPKFIEQLLGAPPKSFHFLAKVLE
jgi:AcrR family transcriptional regulator